MEGLAPQHNIDRRADVARGPGGVSRCLGVCGIGLASRPGRAMARRQIKQAWERLRLTGPGEVRAQPTEQRLNIDRICKTFVVLKREFAEAMPTEVDNRGALAFHHGH